MLYRMFTIIIKISILVASSQTIQYCLEKENFHSANILRKSDFSDMYDVSKMCIVYWILKSTHSPIND